MPNKTPEIGAQTCTQIAENLPKAIERALESYHAFTGGTSAEEPKEFQNRHTAAKAALAHIELLLKLASMVDALGVEVADNLIDKIAAARRELDQFHDG